MIQLVYVLERVGVCVCEKETLIQTALVRVYVFEREREGEIDPK